MDEFEVASMVGKTIRDARKHTGLSQEDLAALAGVERHYLGQLEKGKVTGHLRRLVGVLDALGLELRVVDRSVEQAVIPGEHRADDRA
jgi:transcriptional regulator with XRE-family HTH domain